MKKMATGIIGALMVIGALKSMAHCQIPCGIYTDGLRFSMMSEDITTIKKAISEIKVLAILPVGEKQHHQLIRWVINKEEHAQKIQDVLSNYFLAQRIKTIDFTKGSAATKEIYLKQLVALHELYVMAMKAKQGTDDDIVPGLTAALEKFRKAYYLDHEEEHEHKH